MQTPELRLRGCERILVLRLSELSMFSYRNARMYIRGGNCSQSDYSSSYLKNTISVPKRREVDCVCPNSLCFRTEMLGCTYEEAAAPSLIIPPPTKKNCISVPKRREVDCVCPNSLCFRTEMLGCTYVEATVPSLIIPPPIQKIAFLTSS